MLLVYDEIRMKKTVNDYSEQLKQKEEEDPVLDQTMAKFNAARSYIRRGFKDTWLATRNLYNNKRVEVSYEGNSDTFIPETFTIVQSVKSNIIGGKIQMDWMPTRDDQSGDITALKGLMDEVWEKDRTKLKAGWAIDDSLVTGMGYLFQYVKDGLPCNRYVPTEDAFFDPQAANYEELRYCGYRYLTTIEDLKEETKTNPDYNEDDPESQIKVSKYKNLDKVKKFSEIKNQYKVGDDKTAKQLREEMIAGSTLAEPTGVDKNVDNIVEVICYFDKKRMIKIANRSQVIFNEETPFKREASTIESYDDAGNPVSITIPEIKPFLPVAPARDYTDGAMFYARGEVEIIGELQELLNDTQNQKTDNLNYTLNRMWTLDPSQAHKRDEIQSVPGAVFVVPAGSLEPVQQQNIGTDADNEISRIENTMRRATAADELIQGASQEGDITATEIRAQLAQAGTRFGNKLENYETEFFHILAMNMFKILQIFLTQEKAVRMVGPDGVEWKNYNPGEFLGEYDVKVRLEGTAKVLKETEKQEAMQFYLLASKMPFVNQQALFKAAAKKIFEKDDRDIDSLIMQQPIMMPGTDPAVAQAMGVDSQSSGAMPQQGQGTAASIPMTQAEAQSNDMSTSMMGLNVAGVPQA